VIFLCQKSRRGILFCLLSLLALKSFAEDTLPFTGVLDSSVPYLISQIPAGSKVLVLTFKAETSILSNYLADEITARLVNDSDFTVVDRRDLDIIRQEMNFQMSGEVSDETAVAIGKKIGAQSIIFGSMERSGTLYRLNIRAIEVETAKIQAIRSNFIEQDALLAFLAGKGKRTNGTGQLVGRVLQEASGYLIERIPAGAKIAVFDIKAKNETLAAYIHDSIFESLVNSKKFTPVDRHNLDLLKTELDFQYSGEVSDETTVSIGKKLGAQSIITGMVEEFGELYRLQIRSIDVDSARIEAMQNYLIGDDAIFARLIGKEYKKLYLGAMPGFSIHLFNTDGTDYDEKKGGGSFSIDASLVAEFFVNEMFSLQTGVLYTTDTMTISGQKNVYDASGNLKYSYDTVESFSTQSLSVPLLAGINFYPSVFSLGLRGGIYLDIPLNGVYKNSFVGTEAEFERSVLFGFATGGRAGIKLGPGILFFDAQYMGDLINAEATINNGQIELYKRRIIAFGIGYKIGFINQKK
jgi:TolB-like protein